MVDTGITSGQLIRDWYERYVRPLKQPISLTSSKPQDLGLGLPTSATPTPSVPVAPPTATPVPPAIVAPSNMTSTPTWEVPTPTAADTETPGGSWSDKLTKGLQDPAKMGLLGMGLSMMATPPRQVPYSNTEILGNAGLTGIKYYETALEAKRKDELMKQTAEEHTLAREDRRMASEDRGQYYRDMAETRRLTAESQAEARKATTAENAVLDVPIDPAVAKHYGVDPKMTVRTFNKMQAGLTAMAKPERLVPVKQADGSVTYVPTSEAAGREVAPKPTQKYRNVPGVGMVDISGPEPVVKIKAPVFGRGGGAGGRPTANIQNIEYLVGNGWNRQEAENMILQGKRMPRETFIANMTKSIYGNEFIDDADKASKMQEAIKFYDSTIPQQGGGAKKPTATGKTLDQATASQILQEAGGDKDKARKIAKDRGYTF